MYHFVLKAKFAFLILLSIYPLFLCDSQSIGSCNFDGSDWFCGYIQPVGDNFNWSHVYSGSYFMLANTSNRLVGSKAQLITPEIQSKDTHCFTFEVYLNDSEISILNQGSSSSSQLNVYVKDNEISIPNQPVWNSSGLERNEWKNIELALTPRAYQVIFEAISLLPFSTNNSIAIDNVLVSTSACELAPHFLRLGDKVVNAGQNETFHCVLAAHDLIYKVSLQKSTGRIVTATSQKQVEDFLIVSFQFEHTELVNEGLYRCVSGTKTQVGVSNYARLSVKEPPCPRRGPKVVAAGATHLKIELNANDFVGDGPVVATKLFYRPMDGVWSDIHEISSNEYDLWHLQPDTEYELKVTLARPGQGGAGPAGPALRKKTKCGVPKTFVQNLSFSPLGNKDPASIHVQWDEPDFSITQCHNYAIVVKYTNYSIHLPSVVQYKKKRVENSSSVTIGGLMPYKKYMFKVELTNSLESGSKETGFYTVQTHEAVPGPMSTKSFVATEFNETSIVVEWEAPSPPNGIIQKYEVSHKGLSTFDPNFSPIHDDGYYEVKPTERQLVLGSLHPGSTYNISIRAKTSVGFGETIYITARTDIAPPTLPNYPVSSNATNNRTVTPTTIEIPIIPAVSNGAPVTKYYVIVSYDPPELDVQPLTTKRKKSSESGKRGKGKKRKSRNRKERNLPSNSFSRFRRDVLSDESDNNVCCNDPLTYEESIDGNMTYYASAMFLPDQIQTETVFVVGDNSPNNGFANPPLDPNRDYRIFIRVESEVEGKKAVNCQLVAVKSHVKAPSSTLPPINPASPDSNVNEKNENNLDGNVDEDSSNSTSSPDIKMPAEQQQILMFAGIGIVSLVIVIIVIVAILFFRNRRNKSTRKEEVVNPFEVRMMMSDLNSPGHTLLPSNQSENDNSDRQALMPDVVGYEHQDFMDKMSDGDTARGYPVASNDERFAVRVDDFHVHVSQMKATGGYGFRDEFSSFPDGPTAPWDVAKSTLNRAKNRYSNILAYDHSRVILDPPEGYQDGYDSDYINASYINGYKCPTMYIATQAPLAETINDFWSMVWQEKCTVIVMVTNLVEMGRLKCDKYWPDDRNNYGTIEVSMNKEDKLADYIVRTFVLRKINGYDVREVKQFHFTAWPDHGVPSRPTNLLSYIRKIKAYEPQGQGPTIVHCSAGAGRTGCFIVIDMMLDMARDEDIVDIHNTVRDLRSRRVNMVNAEEQYVFIHEAVLEALLCGETLVEASNLVHHYDDLITLDPQTHFAPIQEEFDTLNVITPKLADDECSVARLPRNKSKNRFMDVLPADRHLAYLVTTDPNDRDNNYVNAAYLDSYCRKDNFLVTQMPLPNTVIDVWRLIYDHRCTSVVMMNDVSEHDQTCAQYWPDTGSVVVGPFTVELLTQDEELDVVCRLFKLQNIQQPSEPYRLVQHFQVTNWPAAQPVPYTRNSVLRIIQLVMKWQDECARTGDRGKTVVHCVAGAGRSGTFMACFNMCEQLRHESSVDIFNIVQRLRNVRPQLVETLEQYRFCYEVGIEFAEP